MTGLVVALDVRTAEEAVRLAGIVAPHAAGFQVGPGLLYGPGPGVVGALARMGAVLVDASLHAIPSQVRAGARRLGEFGARWVTVHAAGGRAMIEAAVEGLAAGAGGRDNGILAVTVLTSLDAASLASAGLGDRPGRLVARLARAAAAAGAEGVTCPVSELGVVAEVEPVLRRVVAGVRAPGSPGDDHAGAAPWEEAVGRGADLVVVGRPIVTAREPGPVAAQIAESLRSIEPGGGPWNHRS